jgi:hypothetical protein
MNIVISIRRGHDQSDLANVFQFSVDCYSHERGRENLLTKVVGLHIGMGTLFYNYFFSWYILLYIFFDAKLTSLLCFLLVCV